nr:MAG TPA: hypothetical protein [Caudoviricetes sp.]
MCQNPTQERVLTQKGLFNTKPLCTAICMLIR